MPTARNDLNDQNDPDPTAEVTEVDKDVPDNDDDEAPTAKRQRIAAFINNLPGLQTCVARTMAHSALEDNDYSFTGTSNMAATRRSWLCAWLTQSRGCRCQGVRQVG